MRYWNRFSHPGPLKILLPVLMVGLVLTGCEPEIAEDEVLLAELPETVDFNYHIRPLLSDRCFKCHGPDENTREADFRLDVEEAAFGKLKESPRSRAIVSGSLRRSEVAHRIVSDDPEYAMPPPESNLSLSDYEVALIRKWIDQGAEWKPHWAFVKPAKLEPSAVKNETWVRNPIDQFVMAQLEREGVAPSPEAERELLLRRVYFDLTGLPPSIEAMDAFLADSSPDAFEQVVDQLLETPAYAERMAMDWMDVARYADSHGYHADGYRMMWPWRDWVIEAFDQNMPYDQFIKLQLAGDLLPDATPDQILATAFNRNHQMTAEGGIVDEEYRLEYVADRTNTTARAFMGLTMECARCHDHKFDPVTQKEYYQLSAFYNNVNEVGMTADDTNAGPMLMLYSDEDKAELATLRDSIASIESRLEQRLMSIEAQKRAYPTDNIDLSVGLVDHYPLDVVADNKVANAVRKRTPADASGDIEVVDGPVGKGVRFDYDYDYLSLQKAGLFDRYQPFSIAAWVRPEKTEPYAELFGNAGNKNSYWRGYEVYLDSLNRVNARLIHALPHNQITVRTAKGIPLDSWSHVAFTYDGSSKAKGITLFIDGEAEKVEVVFDHLYKSMHPVSGRYEPIEQPIRVGRSYRAFSGEDGIFKGSFDDLRIYSHALTSLEATKLFELQEDATQKDLSRLASRHHAKRVDKAYAALFDRLLHYRKLEHELIEPIEEIMVMEEMEKPRATYLLNRGVYDQPKEQVEPGTPETVLAFAEDLPKNRLGLAQWLTSPDNPLTARVTVNRYWQMHFGTGIVATPADMGYQGRLPSHPALLDWLAVSFVESGWDLKALHRLIVTSATYRQSSNPRKDLAERDPENEWLARGPSHRLQAEMIRDNALSASGLLVPRVGGPSAKPYQPEGLWIEKGTFSPILLRYEADKGEGLYRRSLYTFVKRTSPPPSMIAFDATDRSECTVQRQATSTPLQSLILLNDPQYVEASRVLAERMQHEGGDAVEDQITLGFRLLTGRHPSEAELIVFKQQMEAETQRFQNESDQAWALLEVGEHERDDSLPLAETAALAVVANTMMNHDGAYMKR